MVHGESHSHSWHVEFYSRVAYSGLERVYCIMTIACALRWGVASVGVYSTRLCSPRRGTPFQVQGV